MPVIISRNGSISVSGNSKFVSGDLVGGKVTVNGNVIEMGDGIVIGTELPKIDKTINGIQSVDLDDCCDVSLKMGDVFKAVGEGVLRNSGDSATLSQFTGEVTLPNLDELTVTLNSGRIDGKVKTTSVNAKVNSGSVRLTVESESKSPRITATVNSGNVQITVK